MSLENRVKWLFSSAEYFELLSKWSPEDNVVKGSLAILVFNLMSGEWRLNPFSALWMGVGPFRIGAKSLFCLGWGPSPSYGCVCVFSYLRRFLDGGLHSFCGLDGGDILFVPWIRAEALLYLGWGRKPFYTLDGDCIPLVPWMGAEAFSCLGHFGAEPLLCLGWYPLVRWMGG